MQQQISQSTVETALTHAEKWPMTVGFFLAIALMGALAYWLLFKFWPAWLLEQEKHREHLAKALAQRGTEAQQDIGAVQRLHESQQTALVKELGGRIDKVHERVGDVHEVVKQIVQKVGIGLLALGLFSGAFVVGFGGAHFTSRTVHELRDQPAQAEDATIKCDPPCPVGYRCSRGVCKDDDATTQSPPRSEFGFASFASYAAHPMCGGRREEDCNAIH